jgi:hypothetical protein
MEHAGFYSKANDEKASISMTEHDLRIK